MKEGRDSIPVSFPARVFTGSLALTGVMLAAMAWSGVHSYRTIATVQRRDLRIQELRGSIVHLDEVLTMSARLGAATGDSAWERRYHRFQPQLDAAIKEAVELTAQTDSARAAAQTEVANLELEKMEQQGFAFVRAGSAERARAVLFSDAYEAQKQIYTDGMAKLIWQVNEQLIVNQRKQQRLAILSIVAVSVCIVFLSFTWFSVLRRLSHWRAMQSSNLQALIQADEGLRKLNDGLEKRVEDRTRSLRVEIGERRDVEAALRGSEEKFRQLAENITDVFWMTTPDMRGLLYASPAYERLWGRSLESLEQDPHEWLDAIHPEDRERVAETFGRLASEEANVSVDYRVVRPDGMIRWVTDRGFAVRDEAGEIYRTVGIVSDITDRKCAADELRESERRFSDMLRNLELVSMMLDREARITYCNDYLLRLTDWRREEILGRNWFEIFVPPELVEELRGVHSGLLVNQPDAWHHENEIVTRSGARRLIRWNNSVLRSASGEVIGSASIGEDYTDRRGQRDALQERERLAALEADMGIALTRGGTLAEMLLLCAESIVRQLGAAFARIWTINEQEKMLELQASAGMYTHLDGPHGRVPVGKFKIGLIAEERAPHLTNRVVGDPRVGDQEWADREGMVAFAGYPLLVEDRLVGVVAMFARHTLTETTLQALASVSNSIALGIEHKRAEAALRDSEARKNAIVQSSLDCIVTIDHEGNILEFNPAAERVFGYPCAQVLGKELAEVIIPPSLREGHRHGLMRYLATGETRVLGKRIEIVAIRSDGSEFPVELAITRLGSQEPPTFTGFIRDISVRKKAEQQLNIQYAISRVLADSHTAEQAASNILQVVCENFGWDLGELWSVDSSKDVLRCVEIWSAPDIPMDEFKTVSRQMTFAHNVGLPGRVWSSGRSAWVSDVAQDGNFARSLAAKHVGLQAGFAFPIVIGSDVIGVIDMFSRDVRELDEGLLRTLTVLGIQLGQVCQRRRLEDQLFQSQKLETIGKLAGGIAHEFNSILTTIIGQSELLLDDLSAGSPLAHHATEISRAAGRAATLTRQLLAYGRKQFLQPEALDLNRVIASMEDTFCHLMGGGVDTQIIPAFDLRAVKADAGQIEQVIMNMAMNARDAMPNGGRLTLESANVSFDEESVERYPELKPGNYVMLAISDSGSGMDAEVRARVFEPFFSTKGIGQGTGLGLSTCYGIVKQSGGHISVHSEPGSGTTFKIYLPQVEEQVKGPVGGLDPADLPRGTETVLMVEGDPALRGMAATLLRRLGYTVLAAANGIEALSLKQQRGIGHLDLLFTDVDMPHMSGKELSERVRASCPNTRILFTSANIENAIVPRGGPAEGVALLKKPFTPSALAHKLREVLDHPDALEPDTTQATLGFAKTTDT